MKYDIFISYKHKSLPIANNLYYRLTTRGYSVFFDLEEMGRDNFNTQLLNHIDNANDVFVILEEGSLDACKGDNWENDWFCREIAYALKKKKNIIPILIGGFNIPPEEFFPNELKELSLKSAPEFNYSYFEEYITKLEKDYLLSIPNLQEKAISVFKFYSNEDCKVYKDGKLVCSIKGLADKPYYLPVPRKGDYRFKAINESTGASQTMKKTIDAGEEKYIDISWTFKYDIFISCKSEDYKYGRDVYDFLLRKGIKAFLADEKLHDLGKADYGQAIDDALEQSQHLVVVTTSATNVEEATSPYVYYEWHTFSEEKKSGRKKGNIMTIVSRKEIINKLPIALRNVQSFTFNDFERITDFIITPLEANPSAQPKSDNSIRVRGDLSMPSTFSAFDIGIKKTGCLIAFIIGFILTMLLLFFNKSHIPSNREDKVLGNVIDTICTYVDLDLPSGTLWGDRNVGAKSPTDFGNLYAWGEVKTKEDYSWYTYVNDTKSRKDLNNKNDVATVELGYEWSMPTEKQFEELLLECQWYWKEKKGHYGFEVVGKNNNRIFLPASGWSRDTTVEYRNQYGYYWTSECKPDSPFARNLLFPHDGKAIVGNGNLHYGRSVRAVYSAIKTTTK